MRRVKETLKRPLSPADEADAKALDRAVETMIQDTLSGWDHTRPLGSLTRADLRKLATAAVIGWILARAEWDEQQRRAQGSDAGFVVPI